MRKNERKEKRNGRTNKNKKYRHRKRKEKKERKKKRPTITEYSATTVSPEKQTNKKKDPMKRIMIINKETSEKKEKGITLENRSL
jgi:hypothetical protein